MYLEGDGSNFTATGSNTRVTIESNSARQGGGGMYVRNGAVVLVKSGVALDIMNNRCGQTGAGIALIGPRGTSFTVVNSDTRLQVINNTLEGSDSWIGGGGLLVSPGASAFITSPSLFRGNRAPCGAGGAIGFYGQDAWGDNKSRRDLVKRLGDGGSACVPVSLEIKAPSTSVIKVYTVPPSEINSDDWNKLVKNSPRGCAFLVANIRCMLKVPLTLAPYTSHLSRPNRKRCSYRTQLNILLPIG